MTKPGNAALVLCLALCVLLFAGCWATTFTLVAPEQAKVDRNYLGDWETVDAKNNRSSIVIRNIDDKLYYVELRSAGKEDVSRFTGFIADVKAATFAHLRPITDDGSVSDQWMVMRLELTGDKLIIRQLSDEFFKAQKIESAQQLRKVLEENMGNEKMYDKDETITATRVAK